MELVSPSTAYAKSFEDVLREMQEGNDRPVFWKQIGDPKDVVEYIRVREEHAAGKGLPSGWIPASTFWLVDDSQVIGEAHIRHELTEHLRNVGGHIGYWIRPSMRNRGYGGHILRLALPKAKSLGIDRLLITCDETNIASRKIIEANGGALERAQDMGPDAPKKLLFWIDL